MGGYSLGGGSLTLLLLLRLSLAALGIWYGFHAIRRRIRPDAGVRKSLDPGLTRVLRYFAVSMGIVAVCFAVFVGSIVRRWPAWTEWLSIAVGTVAFAVALILGLVAGWRTHAEEEKLAEILRRGDEHAGR